MVRSEAHTPNRPCTPTTNQGVKLSPLVKSVDQSTGTLKSIPTWSARAKRGKGNQDKVCPARPPYEVVLEVLFQPSQTFTEANIPDVASNFTFEEVEQLIEETRGLLAQQDTLLYVSAPCRVVSDLHGQYADLMRMFGWYGAPDGSIPWVFIGDFVDRTAYGCEVLMLLYALKIKWPQKIILLRGNHEIASINEYYGFKEELTRKWGLTHGELLFQRFNDSFMWLPLAAVAVPPGYEGEPDVDQHFVPSRYLLVHGGIGRVETLAQISAVQRPLRGGGHTADEKIMTELVWSDPALSDDLNGFHLNKRDCYAGTIVSYGADMVHAFCERNHITAILRGHECIQEGLELAFGGRVVTFFSAVNYGGHGTNHGCILHLNLTTDEDGMPSIEVQPIRLEAKPLAPRLCVSLPSDDGDLTDVEPDQPSPRSEKPQSFSLPKHYSYDHETDESPEDCPTLSSVYGRPAPHGPAGACTTGPTTAGRNIFPEVEEAGVSSDGSSEAVTVCRFAEDRQHEAVGPSQPSMVPCSADGGHTIINSHGDDDCGCAGVVAMRAMQLTLAELHALKLAGGLHSSAPQQGPLPPPPQAQEPQVTPVVPGMPTTEWLLQALMGVLQSRALAAKIAAPAAAVEMHIPLASSPVPAVPASANGLGKDVFTSGECSPSAPAASTPLPLPSSPPQQQPMVGGAFGSPTEVVDDVDTSPPHVGTAEGTSLEVLLQAVTFEDQVMQDVHSPPGLQQCNSGGSLGMDVDDDMNAAALTPTNSPAPPPREHERQRPQGPPPGFGYLYIGSSSCCDCRSNIRLDSGGGRGGLGHADSASFERPNDEPNDKDQQHVQRQEIKVNAHVKKNVEHYDVPTPPRPSRDAGVFGEKP